MMVMVVSTSLTIQVGLEINIFLFGSVQDVDYEATLSTKISIAKKIFAQEKDLILNSSSFQKFFSENQVTELSASSHTNIIILQESLTFLFFQFNCLISHSFVIFI